MLGPHFDGGGALETWFLFTLEHLSEAVIIALLTVGHFIVRKTGAAVGNSFFEYFSGRLSKRFISDTLRLWFAEKVISGPGIMPRRRRYCRRLKCKFDPKETLICLLVLRLGSNYIGLLGCVPM